MTAHVEHANTGIVDVITDEMRAAREEILHALRDGIGLQVAAAARRLCDAMALPPRAAVAECPGRLVEVEHGRWGSTATSTTRCNVCGKQESL